MSMLGNYFKVALRNLLRHKFYSAINISGLAVGLACCTVIALWVQYHLSFDRFHRNAGRVYKLISKQTFGGPSPEHVGLSSAPFGPALEQDFPEVEAFCRIVQYENLVLEDKGNPLVLKDFAYIDSSAFKLFTFEILAGDPGSALREPGSLVLTDETAARLSLAGDPVGQSLRDDDGIEYKITAVVKKFPRNSHFQFDALVSFSTLRSGAWQTNFNNNCLNTYLMLTQGADSKALEAKIPAFLKRRGILFPEKYVYYLHPLRDMHLRSTSIHYQINRDQSDIRYVYIFSGVALLVLVIACLNFTNLATARSIRRAREVGLRKVLGAGRGQLVGQFLGESVFMALCSMLLAVVLIELSLPMLNAWLGSAFVFDYSRNGVLLLELVGIALAAGVMAGLYPAFFLASFRPAAVLKGVLDTSGRGLGLRRCFIVTQFVISIGLIVCTLFVNRQITYMRNKDLGFDKSQVVILPMAGTMNENFESLRHELLMNPAVTGLTAAAASLGEPINQNPVNYQGKPPAEHWGANNVAVEKDFVRFYGLDLVAGSDFTRFTAGDSSLRYIVNEAFIRKIGWSPESALGQQLELDGTDGTLVGVVKDFNFYSLHRAIDPIILVSDPYNVHGSHYLNAVSVRIRPENMEATLQFLKKIWTRYSPKSPFEYSFLDEDLNRLYQSEALAGRMAGIFSGWVFLSLVSGCWA